MILMVGLGNPGKKYEKTRHNIGFRIVEEFAKESGFPDFQPSKKFKALISERSLGKERIILVKPQIFMNNSGKAVRGIVKFYKIKPESLRVVHDDIDLPLGKIKIGQGQGSAGHKGVQSIINELGTKDFWRVRIGICPKKGKPKAVEKFVLQNFTKEEERLTREAIGEVIKEITKRMASFNNE